MELNARYQIIIRKKHRTFLLTPINSPTIPISSVKPFVKKLVEALSKSLPNLPLSSTSQTSLEEFGVKARSSSLKRKRAPPTSITTTVKWSSHYQSPKKQDVATCGLSLPFLHFTLFFLLSWTCIKIFRLKNFLFLI